MQRKEDRTDFYKLMWRSCFAVTCFKLRKKKNYPHGCFFLQMAGIRWILALIVLPLVSQCEGANEVKRWRYKPWRWSNPWNNRPVGSNNTEESQENNKEKQR